MPATQEEVIDDILENADYEAESSVVKARAYLTALERFQILVATSQSDQGSSMAYDAKAIENKIQRARQFISANKTRTSGSYGPRFLSAGEGFRR